MKNILIELVKLNDQEINKIISELNNSKLVLIEKSFDPIRIKRGKRESQYREETLLIKGQAEEININQIEEFEFVHKVWIDDKIKLDCCNSSRKGKLDDVAECIGAKELWKKGISGTGINIGIVDGGVSSAIFGNRLIGGSNADWGTAILVGEHGNMCATDALGIAPDANLYDLRIFNAPTAITSNSILAFDWALQNLSTTPTILSNSWSIIDAQSQSSTNINHPLNLKTQELIDAGIKVVFSAGNCGSPCPNDDCTKAGSGSIWGPNSLKDVMTVGAVKLNNHRLKYSSQGPGELYNNKPDFCGYSSFKGYFYKDSGTSAACPVVAGCAALLLAYNNNLSQSAIKSALQNSAKDIDSYGFDYNTGFGVVRLDNAYYEFEPNQRPKKDFRDKLCDYVYKTERKCVKWADEGSKKCSKWADEGSQECSNWADEGSQKCSNWADEGSNKCCTWWPCSWGCKAFHWVSKWVCKAFHWVSKWVCKAYYWVSKWVCKAYYWVSKWVCKAYLLVITGITFTNCKCR